MEAERDVLIVGAGIIGLALARELAGRGRTTTVLERGRAGRSASWAAAGMLAPAAELGFEEVELYRLGRESLRRWPDFARDLEAVSGTAVGYRDEGTLVVADDRDAAEALRRLYRFQREHGAPVEWLTGREALAIEPFLSPKLAAAVFSSEDHQVDNRAVVRALQSVLQAHPKADVREGVEVVVVEPGEAPCVVTDDGARVKARVVVLAAGAWTRGVGGLEPASPVRPLKGQALALRSERPFDLRHAVRGPDAYLVPKAGGRLVIGATSEEMGFDTRVTAGGIYRLLEGAVEVVPGVEELEVIETWAGLRPASRDHAPLLGEAAPGVVLATGHYRHGILLAPVTAQTLAADINARLAGGSETSDWLAPFSPRRFAPAFPAR